MDKNRINQIHNHRKMVQILYKKFTGSIPFRAKVHDLDKIILLYIGIDSKKVSKLHRKIASHHNSNINKKAILIEMTIDWESARWTKADKPLNAVQTLYKYYPEMEEKILPILGELNIKNT